MERSTGMAREILPNVNAGAMPSFLSYPHFSKNFSITAIVSEEKSERNKKR